jgi:acyl carrier protein
MENIKVTIIKLLTQYAPLSSIHGNTHLMDDLGLDSFDFVELLMGLEEKFHMEFDGEELEGIRTVDQLAGLMQRMG